VKGLNLTVRKILENDIDMKTDDKKLAQLSVAWGVYYKTWRLKSLRSAIIGHLFGGLQDYLINLELNFGKESDDVDQLIEIFGKRLPIIKEKLNRMLSAYPIANNYRYEMDSILSELDDFLTVLEN
jgi:hypothetical protein